jgi:hypothetical protein
MASLRVAVDWNSAVPAGTVKITLNVGMASYDLTREQFDELALAVTRVHHIIGNTDFTGFKH